MIELTTFYLSPRLRWFSKWFMKFQCCHIASWDLKCMFSLFERIILHHIDVKPVSRQCRNLTYYIPIKQYDCLSYWNTQYWSKRSWNSIITNSSLYDASMVSKSIYKWITHTCRVINLMNDYTVKHIWIPNWSQKPSNIICEN